MTTNLTVPERLRALADGKRLEVFGVRLWRPFDEDDEDCRRELFNDDFSFRIKPAPEMSVPVRRYLFRERENGRAEVFQTLVKRNTSIIEEKKGFIRWLDPDFVSYPVEVQE